MSPGERFAVPLLWLAIAVQLGWALVNGMVLHLSPGADTLGWLVLLICVGYAAAHRRWRWLTVAVRVLISAEFLLSVADRLGVFGGPGSASVEWGDFGHFVSYTARVAAFLPAGLAPVLAVAATVAEIGLGVALLLGVWLRWSALATAGMLASYAGCMAISLPAAEHFHYSVFLLCAVMLAVAATGSDLLTPDRKTTQVAAPPAPG